MQNVQPPIVANPIRIEPPLGALVLRNRLAHPFKSRVVAGLVVIAFAAPLITAACLTPDPSGVGTHRQLGFGECGVLVMTGHPCPTCGMTTAFAHAVRGRWKDAIKAQPMGFLLAAAVFTALIATLTTLVSGRGWAVNWYRISPIKTVILVLLLFTAAWAYKIWSVAANV